MTWVARVPVASDRPESLDRAMLSWLLASQAGLNHCTGSCFRGFWPRITAQAHAFVTSGLSELLSKASWQPTF